MKPGTFGTFLVLTQRSTSSSPANLLPNRVLLGCGVAPLGVSRQPARRRRRTARGCGCPRGETARHARTKYPAHRAGRCSRAVYVVGGFSPPPDTVQGGNAPQIRGKLRGP